MGVPQKDVKIPLDAPTELLVEKHASFIKAFEEKKEDYEYVMTEYLRMSGIYWGLSAMSLLKRLEVMDRAGILEFVRGCQHENGGFSPAQKHDPHLLYTLSAIQILVLYNELDMIDLDAVIKFIQSLQQEDGSFYGDKWGEVDTRFSFCALACLSLMGRLDAVNVRAAVQFVVRCMNFDGGFGSAPDSESHAGQIYCCVGALSMTRSLHLIDADALGWWLCERQLPSGGLNGRPEKLPDVCYSWWVLASLKIIGRIDWIDKERLCNFILAAQDEETGGIADRPGDVVDPFHTLFGIAGLSLLGYNRTAIEPVNPVFCMPQTTIERMGVTTQML